jgi:hypothetical protein
MNRQTDAHAQHRPATRRPGADEVPQLAVGVELTGAETNGWPLEQVLDRRCLDQRQQPAIGTWQQRPQIDAQ